MHIDKKLTLTLSGVVVAAVMSAAGPEIPRELRTDGSRINEVPFEKGSPLKREAPFKPTAKIPTNASYQTSLLGFVYYSSAWEDMDGITPFGVYSISTEPGSQPVEYGVIGKASSHCNGGAVLVGDTYWYMWRQTDPSGTTDINQLYSFNIKTRAFANHGIVSSDLASSSDKTWDPVTGNIYAQHTINGTRMLTIDNYQEGAVTPVGSCDSYFGLACTADGQLYGINGTGDLCKVDKATGVGTKIGSTGITPKYTQSMTIDPRTGDIWWASMYAKGSDAAYSVLYRVDPITAKATRITEFKNQEEIFGLAAVPSDIANDAPGYATDMTLSLEGSSSEGTFSFTLPAYTYMGDVLNGKVDYRLAANGNQLKSGSGQPGERISVALTLPQGSVHLTVACSNAAGEGPAAAVERWVGPGYPVDPENVKFELDLGDGTARLTWKPVTEGENGGFIDPKAITYKVTAYPGGRVIKDLTECSFTEKLTEPESPEDFYYTVTACNDWRESGAVESNHHAYGKGLPVPYDNRFDSAKDLSLFTIIDGNGDGSSWKWSQYRGETANIFTGSMSTKPQDDWLITPGIEMKRGNRYQLSYVTKGNLGSTKFTDHLEVAFGLGDDPTRYKVVEERFRTDPDQEVRHDVIVNVEEDGYYRFGFHCVSDAMNGLAIDLDNIHIDILANENAPAAVTDLKAETSEGTVPVRVSFVTPDHTVNGKKLDKITKVELWRNLTELCATKEDLQPGKKVTLVDNKSGSGFQTYSVVAYNEHGVGERTEIKIFIGVDYPGRPKDITLIDNGTGSLKLTWKDPETGANGGWYDPANVVYNVYSVVNGYAVKYKDNIRGNELTIPNVNGYYDNDQQLVVYGIAAANQVGEGNIYPSSEVILGNPYGYPFTESWVGGKADHSMWYQANTGLRGWVPAEDNWAFDNDGGSACFSPIEAGDMSYLYLGKVDMKPAKYPKLLFNYYAYPGVSSGVRAEVNRAFRDGWHEGRLINFSDMTGEPGWHEEVIDLTPFMSYPYISVRFLGFSDPEHPLFIDNVRIMDTTAGIEELTQYDRTDIQYYDLNGIRVNHPIKGNMYVMRKPDGTVSKVVW